ncbi:MAG: hypothetical protein D3914_11700 [Candidatus Electrothrix sp. LOE2]|nr:hypothetical protein [Candidatus Electrothrix sp. LOE2]
MSLSRTHELFAGFVRLEYIFCFAQKKYAGFSETVDRTNGRIGKKMMILIRMIKRGNKKIYAAV